ncbi:uncharacterized protein ACA1_318410 [Acanthamoeba castellanii str. Neff]|uniref:Uncharacterized protein n=1 Tax=Acanthamoeba castellanii (strain ATCC 30010 / Neff) TaxID=1257118 RepID=L8GJ33_ACACF|nr:uncharacterized protein ACA1_318410 [Acanthamoeba castellanii str. Neff]ELR12176.1 hypothetical protein ACA1_318410 [Acanthamoeba castellanii str. Neff]
MKTMGSTLPGIIALVILVAFVGASAMEFEKASWAKKVDLNRPAGNNGNHYKHESSNLHNKKGKIELVDIEAKEEEDEEVELDLCLEDLKALLREESELEYQRDECLARLAPLVEEDNLHELWRNRNHSLAIACLYNLTDCNDENDARVFYANVRRSPQSAAQPERSQPASLSPFALLESKFRGSISKFDSSTFSAMKYSAEAKAASLSTKARRGVNFELALSECRKLVSTHRFEIEELQRNVTWCEAEQVQRNKSIMAYLRFSTLYEEENALCTPLMQKCRAGLRLVRFDITNGNSPLPAANDPALVPGWVGFGQSVNSAFFTVGEDSEELKAMAYFGSFDQGPIAASFAAANDGALSATVGELPFLAPDLSTWSTTFELNATIHSRCFYAFQMAASFSDPDIGIAFYTPPDQGLHIFDEDGNFITNVVDEEEQEEEPGRRKLVARGPLRETVESCGCVGDPLPHYQAHNHVSPVTEVVYEYRPISAFLIAPTASPSRSCAGPTPWPTS